MDTLLPECVSLVLASLSLRDACNARAACSAWRLIYDDPAAWRSLLAQIWRLCPEPAGTDTDTDPCALFMRHLADYKDLCQCAMYASTCFMRRAPRGNGGQSLQELFYHGTEAQAQQDLSVGVACTGELPAWPVDYNCGGAGVRVHYYEVEIVGHGSQGCIAVGWARPDFARQCKQPGWVPHTYGYHGDDGRAYQANGLGRRFGSTFGTGQVVGTGLILPHFGGEWASWGSIFFTLDGELVGMPFETVARPERLRPTVGLHSPGERVRPRFGGSFHGLVTSAPPSEPAPFAFDLSGYCQRLVTAMAEAAAEEEAAGERRSVPAAEQRSVLVGHWALAAGGEEAGGEEDSDEDEAMERQAMADILREIFRLVEDVEDESEETLAELRFYASRVEPLGAAAGGLHPSWGASSVAELPPHLLRHMCLALLEEEIPEWFD